MPASRAVHCFDRVTAGKTTWNGEGLQIVALAAIVVDPVASLQMGNFCKAVVTHGKASAGLPEWGAGLRDVLNPSNDKGCLEQ